MAKKLTVSSMHCEHETKEWPANYDRHCLVCVAGEATELRRESDGVMRTGFEDGSEGFLRYHPDHGWTWLEPFRSSLTE